MRLIFENLDNPIVIADEKISVFEIHDATLFARFSLSLIANFGENALEQAILLDCDEKEINFKNFSFVVSDCLSFDLNDKAIISVFLAKALRLVEEEEELRASIERDNYSLQEKISNCLIQMQTQCEFLVDWDFIKYCKALGLGIDVSADITLFDKLIHFLHVAADLFPEKILCFVNLKAFLSAAEYGEFCIEALYNKLHCLLLEHELRQTLLYESKLIIDENFLEIIR